MSTQVNSITVFCKAYIYLQWNATCNYPRFFRLFNWKLKYCFLWAHHRHQSELVGDVAVPFCALLSPDARPKLKLAQIFPTVLSQVWLGRPERSLQFLGVGDMQACRAREWPWDLSVRATWPNNLRRLVRTVSGSGCPVRHFEILAFENMGTTYEKKQKYLNFSWNR